MVGTSITKEIATNIAVGRVVTEAEVVDLLFLEHIMEKSAEVLSGLFLKCVMEM